MNKMLEFYEELNNYVTKGYWKVIADKGYVSVEMPETKEMYYVTVFTYGLGDEDFSIKVLKGNLGVNHLAESLNEVGLPIDGLNRSHDIIINFNASLEIFPKEALNDLLVTHHFEMYESIGYPQISFKEKGYLPRGIDESIASDLSKVFEALSEVAIEPLKKIEVINEETKLETLFKKENEWVRETRSISFNDEKIDFSQKEIQEIFSETEVVDKTWYVTSIYTDEVIDDDGAQEENRLEAYVSILDTNGISIEEILFQDYKNELSTVKVLLTHAFEGTELRPKKIILSLRNLYVGAKDFLEDLGIEVLYQPGDEVIGEFVAKIMFGEMIDEDALDEEMFSDLLMMHFLKNKGIDMYALGDLPEQRVEELYDAFELLLNESMLDYEEKLSAMSPSVELSEEAKHELKLNCIIDRIDRTVES